MVFKKAALFVVATSYVLVTCAMEQEIKKPEHNTATTQTVAEKIVRGDILRLPIPLSRELQYDYQARHGIENMPTEEHTRLEVLVTSPESYHWANNGRSNTWAGFEPTPVCNFPFHLPLEVFLNENRTLKTDGDVVTLTQMNPITKQRIKMLLTIAQKESRYGGDDLGKFDECLKKSLSYATHVKPYITEKP